MSINSIPTTVTTVTTGFSPVTAPATGVHQARAYHQVAQVRRIVSRYDEKPFIIISDSKEVLGEGFKAHNDTL